jgi:hypothetical protein
MLFHALKISLRKMDLFVDYAKAEFCLVKEMWDNATIKELISSVEIIAIDNEFAYLQLYIDQKKLKPSTCEWFISYLTAITQRIVRFYS